MRFEPEKTPDIVIVLLLPLVAISLAIFVTLAALAGFLRIFASRAWDKREAAMRAPRRLWRQLHERMPRLRARSPPHVPLFERPLILARSGARQPDLAPPSGLRGAKSTAHCATSRRSLNRAC